MHRGDRGFHVILAHLVAERRAIEPPRSRPGDAISLRAEIDLAIGVTSCSVGVCNGGRAQPLAYEILDP